MVHTSNFKRGVLTAKRCQLAYISAEKILKIQKYQNSLFFLLYFYWMFQFIIGSSLYNVQWIPKCSVIILLVFHMFFSFYFFK